MSGDAVGDVDGDGYDDTFSALNTVVQMDKHL